MRKGQPIISGIYSPSASLFSLLFSLFKYLECHLQQAHGIHHSHRMLKNSFPSLGSNRPLPPSRTPPPRTAVDMRLAELEEVVDEMKRQAEKIEALERRQSRLIYLLRNTAADLRQKLD